MAEVITKFAAKKMLGKQMNKYKKKDVAGEYDPYYAKVPHPTKPGKTKKVKKQIPDYIPEHDAVILAKMRQRAYWLDMSLFNFLGIRFGWSSVIGIIPVFGDAIDCAFALLLMYRCSKVKCGLGTATLLFMLINIAVDFGVGLIPVIGDLADAAIRANTRNVRLLEKRLDEAYKSKPQREAEKRSDHPPPPATVYEDFSEDEDMVLPQHNRQVQNGNGHHHHSGRNASPGHSPPRAPDAARVPQEVRGGEKSYPPSRKLSKVSREHSKRSSRPLTDAELTAAVAGKSSRDQRPSRSSSKRH